ncbi:hypothetical protein Btru_065334, partial [Bulinus truncatus]
MVGVTMVGVTMVGVTMVGVSMVGVTMVGVTMVGVTMVGVTMVGVTMTCLVSSGAEKHVNEMVQLKILEPDKMAVLEGISTVTDCLNAAQSKVAVSIAEEIVNLWCQQVEMILNAAGCIRREADDIGPKKELEFWLGRTAHFSYLLQQIRGLRSRMIFHVLHICKSPVMSTWRELDMKVTDQTNEARDNTKYLYTLEKYCEPLYRCQPITNQIVTSCKNYVSDSGYTRLWDMPKNELYARLKNCIRLFESYINIYNITKKKIANSQSERPFNFSEMYIFGKIHTFRNRIDKLQLKKFMNSTMTNLKQSSDKLDMMKRFDNLNLDFLDIEKGYMDILTLYSYELDNLQQNHRPSVMRIPEGKRAIYRYNKFAFVLAKCEVLFHIAWFRSVDAAYNCLQVPILTRDNKTRDLIINFDPYVYEVIKEAHYMVKLGLQVPREMIELIHSCHNITTTYRKVQ